MAIVMKSAVRVRFISDQVTWEYFIVEEPEEEEPLKPQRVDKETAMEYIREHGLKEAYRTKDGTIWDTPDQSFRNKYRGMGTDKEGARKIDNAFAVC